MFNKRHQFTQFIELVENWPARLILLSFLPLPTENTELPH